MNSDGMADLLTSNNPYDGLNLEIQLSNGDGTFSPFADLNNGSAAAPIVALADVNDDGLPDIVSSGFVDVAVQLNLGGAIFGLPITNPGLAGRSGTFSFGDVDLDGHLDVVSGAVTGTYNAPRTTIVVSRGDGLGGFAPILTRHFDGNGSGGLCTLDRDGAPDLYVHSGPGVALRPEGCSCSGTSAPRFNCSPTTHRRPSPTRPRSPSST